jgi:hypothetical protein
MTRNNRTKNSAYSTARQLDHELEFLNGVQYDKQLLVIVTVRLRFRIRVSVRLGLG